MVRRFVLVGLMVTVKSGQVMQLAIGTLLAIVFFFFQLMASPFRDPYDNFLASATSFSIVVSFLCANYFKYSALLDLDDIQDKMSSEQRETFVISDYATLTWILMLSILTTLIATVGIFVVQLRDEVARARHLVRVAKARRLRHVQSGKEVEAPTLVDGRRFHLFLSHVWGTGQDQMRIGTGSSRNPGPSLPCVRPLASLFSLTSPCAPFPPSQSSSDCSR